MRDGFADWKKAVEKALKESSSETVDEAERAKASDEFDKLCDQRRRSWRTPTPGIAMIQEWAAIQTWIQIPAATNANSASAQKMIGTQGKRSFSSIPAILPARPRRRSGNLIPPLRASGIHYPVRWLRVKYAELGRRDSRLLHRQCAESLARGGSHECFRTSFLQGLQGTHISRKMAAQ